MKITPRQSVTALARHHASDSGINRAALNLRFTLSLAFDKLVDLTKLRWRIERDYQELKQEVWLGHFEGRGWRGFHHHTTLCIAAYG